MIAYGLANFGRTAFPDRVRESMARVARKLRSLRVGKVVFVPIEIGEGDSGYDDHQLLRNSFDGFDVYHGDAREPILTLGLKVLRWSAHRFGIKGSAVKHQSPPRSIQQLVVEQGDRHEVAGMGGHFAAGVENGHRPPWIRALLAVGYWRMWRRLKRLVRKHRRAGRSVVVLVDVNDRTPRRLHRKAVVMFHHGPDWAWAIPAPGYEVEFGGPAQRVELTIEPMHDAWYRLARFVKSKEENR